MENCVCCEVRERQRGSPSSTGGKWILTYMWTLLGHGFLVPWMGKDPRSPSTLSMLSSGGCWEGRCGEEKLGGCSLPWLVLSWFENLTLESF